MPSADPKTKATGLAQCVLPRMPLPIQGDKPKVKSAAKGKRMTLPLEDQLVLAELVDVLGFTKAASCLEGIERSLRRIAECLENRGKRAADGEDDDDIPF